MNGDPAPPPRLSAETRTAARSALQLGLSLFATWSVAVLVRLYLPRRLGPHDFGAYSFAEGLAASLLAFLGFGVDSYTLRELPTRPAHASDYFGGMVVLRGMLGALLLAGLAVTLGTAAFDPLTTRLGLVFGLGFLIAGVAQLLSACLQANATVGRLALVNVAAKLVWGAAVGLALVARWPLELVAGAFVLSEALKAALLYRETQARLGLVFRVDSALTRGVLVASLPFFANSLAVNLNRLDVTVLGFMAGRKEVGWYGAASSFSLLVFMFAPLMGSVVLPMLARVRARSEQDFLRVMGRLAQGLLMTATPLALIVALGAELWVRLAFGEAFGPAAVSLRVLAMLALLSYLTLLLAMALITLDRRWTVTLTSVLGLVINPLLGVLLIPACARVLGPGGAGAGAALGVVGMEATVIALQLRSAGMSVLGPGARDVAGRCLLACLAAIGLHLLLAGLGHFRLVLDAVAYALVALVLGVLPVRQLLGLTREILESRRT